MKQFLLAGLTSCFFLLMTSEVFGDNFGSSQIEKLKPLEPLKQGGAATTPKESPPQPVRPRPTPIAQQADYLHPGILVFLNGKWEGSDHLYNLTNNIGVSVSIVKPEDEVVDITEAQIQKEVENIFIQANIRPQTLVPPGKPPLPTFEIEIFVYPIEKGYVASCNGRLFEAVTLERFKMDPNMAFQAITWEKQNLLVSPKSQLSEQLTKTVQGIASAFAERFQAYEKLKRK